MDRQEPGLERFQPALSVPGTFVPRREAVRVPDGRGGWMEATLRGWLRDSLGRWCALLEWDWGRTVREDWFLHEDGKIIPLGEW